MAGYYAGLFCRFADVRAGLYPRVVAAAAVAQARAGLVEGHERHNNHVECFGRHDGEAVAADVRGSEGSRGMSDKRSRGRIVGGNCPHAHTLATSCGSRNTV